MKVCLSYTLCTERVVSVCDCLFQSYFVAMIHLLFKMSIPHRLEYCSFESHEIRRCQPSQFAFLLQVPPAIIKSLTASESAILKADLLGLWLACRGSYQSVWENSWPHNTESSETWASWYLSDLSLLEFPSVMLHRYHYRGSVHLLSYLSVFHIFMLLNIMNSLNVDFHLFVDNI